MAAVKRRVVLVANDDPGLHRLIETTLGAIDFEVLHAHDGEETLQVARQSHPELIVLAANLPKVDGFTVCQEVKAQPATSSIKVVILTERNTETDRALGRQAGADDYFIKPFSPVHLLNTIYALLE